jgi:TolB protein
MNSKSIKIKFIILMSFVLLALTTCREDTIEPASFGSLSGTVVDNFNDQFLSDVEINTNPSSSVVFSDDQGKFLISEIPTGDYSFTAHLNGYKKTFVNATIAADITTEITIKMEREITLPDPATNPTPLTGAVNQPRDLTLIWETTTPKNDSLTYDVFVYESNTSSIVFSSLNTVDTLLSLNDLRYATTYFWQVNVKSSTGGESKGDIWNFTTIKFPDNRLAFTSNVNGNYQVYSSNDNSDQKIQITRTPYNSLHPLFSADRGEIAFSANKTLDYQIFIMNFDGTNTRQITTIPIAGFHSRGSGFCWWPDNGGFIYSHYDNLYSIDRHGANLKVIATAPPGRNYASCDYSASTNKLVVQTVGSLIYEGEIYLMNTNGTDTVRIVDDLSGNVKDPTFSIDGKQVMYTHDVSGFNSQDGRQLDTHIFILDLESMLTTDVSNNKPSGTNDLQPRFSPFGAQIIFTNALNDGSGEKSVYVMDIDGANRSLLFENAEMPNWK